MPALRKRRVKGLIVVAGLTAIISVATGSAWQADATINTAESSFVPVPKPERILDTRNSVDIGLAGPFVSRVPQKLRVTGAVPTASGTKVVVPDGATGVVLNVTAINSTADAFVSINPGDFAGEASTSTLNFVAGDIVPNAATVAMPTSGPDAGTISITYDAYGAAGHTTDLLIDVVGYLTNSALQELQLELVQTQAATNLLLQERPIAQAFIENDGATVTVHGPQTVTAARVSAVEDYLEVTIEGVVLSAATHVAQVTLVPASGVAGPDTTYDRIVTVRFAEGKLRIWAYDMSLGGSMPTDVSLTITPI
jgi:hypothetical protein